VTLDLHVVVALDSSLLTSLHRYIAPVGIGSSSAEGLAAAVTLKMKKGQNTLSTWEYIKLMAKIKFLDPLLEWTNRHCGCVYLIEYIPFVNPKPSPLPAPPFAVTRSRKERGEGEEEKRREEKGN